MILLQRLRRFEPARLRAVYTAVLAVLATLGITIPTELDGRFVAILSAVAVLLPLLQGESTRAAVTPNAEVDNLLNGAGPDA